MWETTGDWLFHWRKHYYGLWTLILVKNVLMDLFFTSTQLLSSPDVNWWTGVVWITCGLLWCFYQLFGLSFWRHPFTAEHPLLRQWCSDTFLQIWWRNKLIYILNGLRVRTFSVNIYFWGSIPTLSESKRAVLLWVKSQLTEVDSSVSLLCELWNRWLWNVRRKERWARRDVPYVAPPFVLCAPLVRRGRPQRPRAWKKPSG